MLRRPQIATRPDTLVPSTTLCRSGFGPEFNLVTLNGRQMPTALIGDGGSAPSSRLFDFANLASEGIAAVEVYKSGRATVESGDRKSTRLNSSHSCASRMPSSARKRKYFQQQYIYHSTFRVTY